MPEIPPKALGAAIAALHSRDWLLEFQTGELREEQIARFILEAAAPILAEAVAAKINAHRDNHGPEQDTRGYLSWRRYLGIAAQVASLAFSTEQEQKRMAAEALARGAKDCSKEYT